MAFVRWFIGKIILFLDALTAPKAPVRSPEEQARLQALMASLAIYEYRACPFCVKVRRFLKGAGVSVELRDAKSEPWRSELLREGGKLQVPCLRIPREGGSAQWMYESNDIIAHLRQRLGLAEG